jgi:tetraprenyl-beta-curcumene synthase
MGVEGRGGTRRQALVFARAAHSYWLDVFPATRRELRRWRDRAESIPDPKLREDALFTLRTKWGHSEGAAAFAVLAPRAYRRRVVRMAIAYQVMIDYLDTISELPLDDPGGNTLQLHRALYAAVSPKSPLGDDDYYALHPYSEDGGFLAAQIADCREVFMSLPGCEAVAETALRFATLYAEAQGICHASEAGREEPADAECTRIEAKRYPELQWGEMIAAGASSLPVLAVIVAAASSRSSEQEVESLSSAYYPWSSALHILLHGLVDQAADKANDQFNQLNHYRSKEEAAERLTLIASRAQRLVSDLQQGELHAAILAGMGSYYLAPPQVWEPEDAEISRGALSSLGPLAKPALLVHRVRRGGPRAALRPLGQA